MTKRSGVVLLLGAVAAGAFLLMPRVSAELPPGGTFVDDDGSVHEGAIEALVAAGAVQGCSVEPRRFCPDQPTTRAQLAALLARALDLPPASQDWFDDDNSHFHEDAINRLREAGITLGCDTDSFCPNDSVSRAQLASLFARALGLPPASQDWFDDDDGHFQEDAINRLREAGITRGCDPEGRLFCPDEPVTRGQAASFLARALGLTPTPPPPRDDTSTTSSTSSTTTTTTVGGGGLPPNLPPTADDQAVAVAEDSSSNPITLTGTDPEGAALTFTVVTPPTDGTLGGSGANQTYTPNADFSGTDSFTFRVNDGTNNSALATVTITVTGIDDDPVAVDDTFTTPEDTSLVLPDGGAGSPADNDTDVDGDALTVTAVSNAAGGVVGLGGGTITFTPTADLCGPGAGGFDYEVSDGAGPTDTGQVTVDITCADEAPVAVDDSATVVEDDLAATVDVLGNDTDVDGGPISVQSVTQPANGTVVITNAGADLSYEPDPDYCNDPPGTTLDTFTYTLSPGGSTATVSVTVTCVDDALVAVNDSATVVEDDLAATVDVLGNDTDVDGGPRSVQSVTQPANGTVVITNAGADLSYEPDPNYCNDPPGTTLDTFTYTVNGGDTATVTVTVTCVPDPASVVNSAGPLAYTENDPATAIDPGVTVNDPDVAGITDATISITTNFQAGQDALDWTDNNLGDGITEGASTPQTVVLTGNGTAAEYEAALATVTYQNTSESPSTLTRTVTFSINAGAGSDTIDITVASVDDPPVAVDDAAPVLEDATATTVDVIANDTDIDAGPKTVDSVTQPTNGTVVITNAGADLTYQPDADYCNDPAGTPDTFDYTLNGGDTGTVSVTVTCINDAPIAGDETFSGNDSAIGNTAMVVNDPDDGAPALAAPKTSVSGDILANDTDVDGPAPTITPGTFATDGGGSVTIEADGDFTFFPAPATSCTDMSDFFDYTVEDSGTPALTDTGRVTIAISGCVWYVNNNAAGNSGTSTAPFDTLAQAETASGANHTVFVFDGDNSSTGYNTGYAMNAGERLIGEHEGLVVDPDGGGALTADVLLAANPGAHPTLTASNEDVIDLDDGNEVRGFNLDPSGTGGGIAGTTGDTGGGTIDDVNIVDTGTAGTQPGLELDATTGTFTITNLVINNTAATAPPSTATGVRLNNAGTVVFTPAGTITITIAGARGFDATSTNLGTSTIDDITVTGSPVGGVALTSTTGTIALGDDTGTDLNVTTTGGTGLLLSHAGATGVTIGAGGTDAIHSTGGPAVDITGSGNFAFDDVDSTNSTGDGINLASFGGSGFSAGSGSTISGITAVGGVGFDLDGGNGTVDFDGTISSSGSGRSVDVTNRTGATVDFNGLVTDNGVGINLSANGAGLVRFDGGITASTGANTAFNATVSGSVAVTDTNGTTAPNNTLTTTTGTALNVQNTTIHSDDLTFLSISSNGAANGIVLNNTGSSGGLTVTGDAGTCTTAVSCTGGAIQNTTGVGIFLTNTEDVDLTRMYIANTGSHGVSGTGMADATADARPTFGFHDSFMESPGNADNESALFFDSLGVTNITGQLVVDNTTIQNFEDVGVHVGNISGTLDVDVTSVRIDNNSDTNGEEGIDIDASGTATINVDVTGSRFQALEGGSMNIVSQGSGTIDMNIMNNVDIGAGGPDNFPTPPVMTFAAEGPSSNFFFDISGNKLLDVPGDGIFIGHEGEISGRIVNNDITGVALGDGIRIDTDITSNQTSTIQIDNNRIGSLLNFESVNYSGIGDDGIQVLHRDGTKTLNLTITNNTITNTASEAIRYFADDDVAGGGPENLVKITGNTFGSNGTVDLSDSIVIISQDPGTNVCTQIASNTTVEGITLQQSLSAVLSITQASTAELSTANGGATVTPIGTTTVNVACNPPLPSNP